MKGGEFMYQKLSHEEFVDIIDILYIKTFRLKNSWDFLSLFIFNGNMENRYPDLTYSLKYSFGIDAYTTINALFSSGKYSFSYIKKADTKFEEEYQKAWAALQESIPRNRQKLRI